ncbi:hypothetical protein SBI80_11890 [Mycolicibacterium sp. 050158]|nr:hypothetical protein [Mycolicibacterium sp. 050158]MDX1890282.1 hypothetical protein [Mycolicibacterium sp. 050158]
MRRQPEAAPTPAPAPEPEQQTGIIRRHPTGSLPVATSVPTPDPRTSYIPRATPLTVTPPASARPSPAAAAAAATVSILSGWATAVIATSLISGWWRTDELFCIAIGFLTTVSAAATIGGLISLLLRRRIGRLLIVVGSVVALMIFAGLFVAGANLPQIVYAIPVLPVASIVLALLPATGRWCR